jgi:hypothetical protein
MTPNDDAAPIEREQDELNAALDSWNDFYETHGSFADEHSTL